MDYEKAFERIYEKANYARVEDSIKDLYQSLDTDSKEVGYGIARNTMAYGNLEDLSRLETLVKGVSSELNDISKGIVDYEMTVRRTSPQPRGRMVDPSLRAKFENSKPSSSKIIQPSNFYSSRPSR